MRLTFKRSVTILLVLSMCWVNATRSFAMLAPAISNQVTIQRGEDLATVQAFLEQKQVTQKLTEFGLTQQEVKSRLSNLSDKQLHQVAMKIDKEHPAADGGGFLVTVLLIGILVLLFVYLVKRV